MPLEDMTAADWLVAALPDFRGRVVDLVTDSFPCYARIFHRPDQGLPADDGSSSWASIASDRGTVFHPAAQFTDLALDADRAETERGPEPLLGSLDPMTLPLLRDHLAKHTTTPDVCWFALWPGFGSSPARWQSSRTFHLPGRQYWLFAGALTDVVEVSMEFDSAGLDDDWLKASRQMGMVRSPTIWWPQDQAWLVHSEIDYDSTLVGGASSLIEALVGDPGMEALQVDPDTSLFANGDTINGSYPSGWSGSD